MSTYEFSTTVKDGEAPTRVELARKIAALCRENGNALFNGNIMITEDAVFNGSGDLRWINWRATVTDLDWPRARYVRDLLKAGYSLDAGVSENMPDDFDAHGMFTREGTACLIAHLGQLEGGLRDGTVPAQLLTAEVDRIQGSVAAQGHGEVFDTSVRERIWDFAERVLKSLGLSLVDA